MWTLPSFLRFLVILLCLGLVSSFYPRAAAAQTVGTVTKVHKQAQIGSRTAVVGAPVRMKDQLRTGAGARMQVTFRDGTTLTLGENARVGIDRYVYNPAKSTGAMTLKQSRGALRLATGKLNRMRHKDITVSTPVAALAVRGTEFWSGPIDGHHGAYLVKGKVSVSNRHGAVMLSKPGQGTDIRGRRGRRRR